MRRIRYLLLAALGVFGLQGKGVPGTQIGVYYRDLASALGVQGRCPRSAGG